MRFASDNFNFHEDTLDPTSFTYFTYKEADTGKYILVSDTAARGFGVPNSADLIGQKMDAMCKFLHPKFADAYQKDAEMHDFLARDKKNPITRVSFFLTVNGGVAYRQVIKHPTLGKNRKVLSIFSCSNDLTSALPYSDLYKLHRRFYAQEEAIKRTLTYLGIDESFIVLPSEAQFRVFLAKAQRYPHKQIARYLNLSPRTVDCHVNALRNKVIDGDLNRVLACIKGYQLRLTDDEGVEEGYRA